MKMEKWKKRLDFAHKVQNDSFWKSVFHSRKPGREDGYSDKEEKMNYNLYQWNDFLVLELELPGLDQHEFQMWMDHQNLLIKTKTTSWKKKKEPVYFVKKRRVIPNEQHIPLPVPVFTQPVNISQKNGLWYFRFKPIPKEAKSYNTGGTDSKSNK